MALASQKTLENLFGGMMVIGDSPVRIGQFCRVGTMTGTVEDIGLRSTRIRTLDRTVISIPNADMAIQSIENFATATSSSSTTRSRCGTRRRRTSCASCWPGRGRSSTSIRRSNSDTARVRLVRFAASGLDVELFAYVTVDGDRGVPGDPGGPAPAPDGHRSSRAARRWPSRRRRRTSRAMPESTGEKAAEAARAVQAWRERGELPFPDESSERKTSLAGGIDTRRQGRPWHRRAGTGTEGRPTVEFLNLVVIFCGRCTSSCASPTRSASPSACSSSASCSWCSCSRWPPARASCRG